jgi:hypothetical protein
MKGGKKTYDWFKMRTITPESFQAYI